ncbi:hypothetical protein AMAG_03133 [Allomyces macrogynus ATCC 38327]|uniref:MI domain-containing protein n=1 Tax=Allomyces macrogynus (strain ATCC 38327) TaxID=578462 RepID=A0A0L0S4V2_ALLM3|nr:hypothetical protein AMAG_03133 [Allomyces macrogynus ATCC 38327]|eukprot:KNE57414.1 hypothetical protein AMAG_03133 [Allomyces macrogynus ATCC 38327]
MGRHDSDSDSSDVGPRRARSSRSPSPPRNARDRSASPVRSRSPPLRRRRASPSPSVSPGPRAAPDPSRSPSPRSRSPSPQSRSRSRSRSRSQLESLPQRSVRRDRSSSPPRRASRSSSRSISRSRSRSRSPPNRAARRDSPSSSPPPRRRADSASRSPPPRRSPSPRSSPPRRRASRTTRRSPPRHDPEDGEVGPASPPRSRDSLPAAAPAAAVKPLTMRTGGAYIPPAKLRAMQAQISDKSSEEYQRMSWEALKKSINGLINKINASNIKNIIPELINENLIRGRGLFCRSIMKSQAAALPFTPVYAAAVAVLNTKFPQLGELLVMRLIMQFRRAYKRNDKLACLAVTLFIAHLVNHKVCHEIVALQILMLLLERPTDDSVEVAVGFLRECGAFLTDAQSRALNAIFERFRTILHEAALDVRTQYMIEVLFQVRKDKFKDNPPFPEELDLVEEDDQVTHYLSLDDQLQTQDLCNVFAFDPHFLANEAKYAQIKREILGSDDEDSSDASGSDADTESSDEEDDEADRGTNSSSAAVPGAPAGMTTNIIDATGQDLMALRKRIYLTLMSALDFEEACHKLLKLPMQEGQQMELVHMIIECCSQERTYKKYYGLIAERFCKINRLWADLFAEAFAKHYATIHRFETAQLRNVAKLFGHVLATDAMPWPVLQVIRMTEDDTTSASRIFVKILFQELRELMGMVALVQRVLRDPYLARV